MKCGPGFKKGICFKQIGEGVISLVNNYVPNPAFIPNYLLATSRLTGQYIPNNGHVYASSKRYAQQVYDSGVNYYGRIYMSTPIINTTVFKKLKLTIYTISRDTEYFNDDVTCGIASAFYQGDYVQSSFFNCATFISSVVHRNGTTTYEFDVSSLNSVYVSAYFHYNPAILNGVEKPFNFVNIILE